MTRHGERPTTAMVLAAGIGARMRPLTDNLPKPLVRLAGRPLIDHVLDRLAQSGVARVVVNVHHCADILEAHLSAREAPRIAISDERSIRLDTGGGVARALRMLGDAPFYIHNSDSVWLEHGPPTLQKLAAAWDGRIMDSLMLLAPASKSLGYEGRGDFEMSNTGALERPLRGAQASFAFTGVSIAHPRLFDAAPDGAFSLNALWDRAIASGRLHGVALDGLWMHVGTPEALAEAESAIANERSGGV